MFKTALFAALVCALAIPASAKTKPDDSAYQDAVMVDFQTESTGTDCSTRADTSGTVNASTDPYGSTTGRVNGTTRGTTSCEDTQRAIYHVSFAGHVFTLTPAVSPIGIVLPGLARAMGNSVLYGTLPGTHIRLRSESGGVFYVKVGKKESRYKLVAAQ